MDEQLPHLIKRLALDRTTTTDLCDFTLEEQNALSEAQGVTVTTNPNYTPVLSKSVNYIVAFILINELDEVLMMQEARESCAGKWYLPAGRMEPGETIEQAAQREVLEETGLVVEITTLLTVETAGGSWFRFVVTGNLVGGELKTPDRGDSESLQAKWIGNLDELPLRSQDVVGLINYARLYKSTYSVNVWPRDILPTAKPHTKNYVRLICTIKRRKTNRFQILYSEKDQSHYPMMQIHPERNFFSTLIKFMKEIFGSDLPQHRPQGLFNVEHSPTALHQGLNPTDGLCLTLLVLFRPAMEDVSIIGKYAWEELSAEESKDMERLIAVKHALVQLSVLR